MVLLRLQLNRMEVPKLPDVAVVVVEVVRLVHQLLLELDRSEHLLWLPVFALESISYPLEHRDAQVLGCTLCMSSIISCETNVVSSSIIYRIGRIDSLRVNSQSR